MINCVSHTTARWSREIAAAAGAVAAAATLPLLATAPAQADSDLIINPVQAAVILAETPIYNAQTAIEAVPQASLSATEMAILSGQESFNSAQLSVLDFIEATQLSITDVPAGEFATLDDALITADNAVLEATLAITDFQGNPLDPFSDAALLFVDYANLLNADVAADGADLNVILSTEAAALFGGVISPGVIF